MKDITVVILAGGDGTRFWPLKDKLFTQFLGKPLLYYRLNQLQKFGFIHIIVIGNDANEELFDRFMVKYPSFKFSLIKQTDKRGMAGAVLGTAKMIKGRSILVLKPVDIFEDMLFNQLKLALKENPDNLLTGFTTSSYFPGGYLTVEKGLVSHIVEKPPEGKMPSNLVRLVFDYFKDSERFLEYLKSAKSTKDDHYEVALENMIQDHLKFNILNYEGYWGYLQYPWHVLSIASHFLSKLRGQKKGRDVDIASSAILKGDIYIDDGVKILENAKIIGPAYIGKNTLIGNNCIIRESMIGQNCVLGFTTEVTRSFISDNCWFHSNYIGDSVVDDNVGMGSGAVVANFRLDEKSITSNIGPEKIDTHKTKFGAILGQNVRIGVNTSLMPGVKVGKNTFIGSGLTLDQDIAESKVCFVKSSLVIKENKETITKSNRQKFKSLLKV